MLQEHMSLTARRNSDMGITGKQLRRVLSTKVPPRVLSVPEGSNPPPEDPLPGTLAPTAGKPAAKPPGYSSTSEVILPKGPRCAVGDTTLQPFAQALAEAQRLILEVGRLSV